MDEQKRERFHRNREPLASTTINRYTANGGTDRGLPRRERWRMPWMEEVCAFAVWKRGPMHGSRGEGERVKTRKC
ncbi:hypothetical protein S83_058740 [Arachis hypogaea]